VRILVTNDDGVHAPALEPLQRATSHSLTLHRPLRIHRHDERRFSVDGTPTDCVLIASHGLLQHKPDLVVSGINHGPNMGEDVFYSGTVAAAIEGAMPGVPAIAASLVTRDTADFTEPARFIRDLASEVMRRGPTGTQVLNVNLPHRPWSEIQGVRFTRLGSRVYSDALIEKVDPRGRAYYWIGGRDPVWQADEGTDFQAVSEGYISVTPLALDLTDFRAVVDMERWYLQP
jgi:5'-nucleotidase